MQCSDPRPLPAMSTWELFLREMNAEANSGKDRKHGRLITATLRCLPPSSFLLAVHSFLANNSWVGMLIAQHLSLHPRLTIVSSTPKGPQISLTKPTIPTPTRSYEPLRTDYILPHTESKHTSATRATL